MALSRPQTSMDDDETEVPPPIMPNLSRTLSASMAVTGDLKTHLQRWDNVLESILPAIVEINVNVARCFDGDSPALSTASGFVVDAQRGYILTNRHVVTLGPVTMHVIFPQTQEELEVTPIYRDPVHDFAFCRFDPSALKFTRVSEIKLAPEEARVGEDIRVVGNDASERLQILSGTIGRLDRAAPRYGFPYSDFNTFYIGAASGTSPGSSGSPVININGHAVALNCGASIASNAAFYLPLERVVRALNLIRCGHPVPRGTIQTLFKYVTFNEARKLGLSEEMEKEIRRCFPQRSGLLSVEAVTKEGPAVTALQPGDILLGMNGHYIIDFVQLESTLDTLAHAFYPAEDRKGVLAEEPQIQDHYPLPTAADAAAADAAANADEEDDGATDAAAGGDDGPVGDTAAASTSASAPSSEEAVVAEASTKQEKKDEVENQEKGKQHEAEAPQVKLTVIRAGQQLEEAVRVQDTHSLLPTEFLEVGGAVLHKPSYVMAVTASVAVKGVYVAHQGVVFRSVSPHAMLERLNGSPVTSLEDVATALENIPHGHFFTAQYRLLSKPHEMCFSEGRSERLLTPLHMYSRDILADIRAPASGHVVWRRHLFDESSLKASPPLIRGLSLFSAEQETRAKKKGKNNKQGTLSKYAERQFLRGGHDFEALSRSVVSVMSEDSLAFSIDGAGCRDPWTSIGVVIDKALGLVLTLRSTVKSYMSNVTVIMREVVRVPATVMWLHPCHNIAIVKYDASQIPAELTLSEVDLCFDAPVVEEWTHFLERSNDDMSEKPPHVCDAVVRQVFHKRAIIAVGCPEFNEVDRNINVVGAEGEGLHFRDGLLYAIRGRRPIGKEVICEDVYVQPDAVLLRELLQSKVYARPMRCRWLEAEFGVLKLSEARRLMGLSTEWLTKLEINSLQRNEDETSSKDQTKWAIYVSRPMLQTHPGDVLLRGDIVLQVDGKCVQTLPELESMVRNKLEVTMLLWRNQEELTVTVRTERLDRVYMPMRAIEWAGATLIVTDEAVRLLGRMPPVLLQAHAEVAAQGSSGGGSSSGGGGGGGGGSDEVISRDMIRGIFCSIVRTGSPCSKMEAGCWILAINDQPIYSLEDVLNIVTQIGHKQEVRITIYNYSENRQMVISVKTDLLFWPTAEFTYDEDAGHWVRTEVKVDVDAVTAAATASTAAVVAVQDEAHAAVAASQVPPQMPYPSILYMYPSDTAWQRARLPHVEQNMVHWYYQHRAGSFQRLFRGSTHQTTTAETVPVGKKTSTNAAAEPEPGTVEWEAKYRTRWWNEELLPVNLRSNRSARHRNKKRGWLMWLGKAVLVTGASAVVVLGGYKWYRHRQQRQQQQPQH